MLLTHAYALWAANVLLAVFAPAFPLSFHDRKFARSPPKPIASVVSRNSKNKKLIDLLSKRPKKTTTENQRFTWSLVRIRKKEKIPLSYKDNDQKAISENQTLM